MRLFGIGALIAGSIAVMVALLTATVLIGPILFWIAWNVLDFAKAVGLPELGFWGIVLATVFLGLGWAGKIVVTAIVFVADPGWFHGAAQVHWPEPTFRNFAAIALLALIATRPRASRRWERRNRRRRRDRWPEWSTERRY